MISKDDIDAFTEETLEDENTGVYEWLTEMEVCNTRYERLCITFAELDAHAWKDLVTWLDATYTAGWKRGRGLE